MSNDKIRKMVELARAHIEAGGIASAGVYYRMILRDASPPKTGVERVACGEACMWYARKAIAENSLGTATDWYRRAVEADPRAVDYRLEYVTQALMPMSLFKIARIEAERATKIEPDNIDAWKVLAGVEQALGNVNDAIAASERELSLAPNDPYARLDRCVIAMDIADYDTIEEMCIPVLKHKQLRGEATNYLAMVAYRLGKFEKAIQLYDEAIELGIKDPDLARWNKSLAMHSIGNYREGWPAHEARGKQKTDAAMRLIMNRFTKPIWQGEPAPARLHLHQEMGFGDVIAMSRYVPLLIEKGYDVRLEVNDSLVALMQRSFPQAKVIGKAIDYPGAMGIEPFDYHIPMLSLPAMFKTDIDTVPWTGPYLTPDPVHVKEYAGKLLQDGRQRVGVCWSSGVRQEGIWLSEYGRRKSTHLSQLYKMMGAARATFVSLQVGPESEQATDRVSMLKLLPKEPTWDDTAALIANLDLVITVDTSVAHLAGALGVPTWVMMHTEGSWHWMTKRLDSPWYPSVRLFRQEKPHYWNNVMLAIAAEIGVKERLTA